MGHLGQIGEVVGVQDLALHDREVDLDLVQPGGVDGQVDQREVLLSALQPVDQGLAAVRGAVVDHPQHPAGRGVRLGGHHLLDSLPNGWMPVVGSQRPNSRAWCTSQAAR